MREMGSAVGEQRQRLLMSRTASFGAPSVAVAASVHKQSSLEYPAGVASAILTVSASGYLSGCFPVVCTACFRCLGQLHLDGDTHVCVSTGWLSGSGGFS